MDDKKIESAREQSHRFMNELKDNGFEMIEALSIIASLFVMLCVYNGFDPSKVINFYSTEEAKEAIKKAQKRKRDETK